jgi:hypothetical protein
MAIYQYRLPSAAAQIVPKSGILALLAATD